ncbi:MAG: hypothetical protein ABI573_07660 [Chloroflexota bacterium]
MPASGREAGLPGSDAAVPATSTSPVGKADCRRLERPFLAARLV